MNDRKAPTFDDLHDALREGKLLALDNVIEATTDIVHSRHGVEQFNFGALHRDTLVEAATEAFEFVKEGLFTMPFPMVFYRASIIYPEFGPDPAGISLLALTRNEHLGCDVKGGVGVVHYFRDGPLIGAMNTINRFTIRPANHPKFDGEEGTDIEISRKELDFWGSRLKSEHRGKVDINDVFTEGAMLLMGLTMIINTKGVFKERREPPAKPNRMRERSGRPLLPYVTTVHTSVYNRAVTEPHIKGTHASPRPHKRRAHIRTYTNPDGSVKQKLPIEAMLVNWDGTPLTRKQYEVRDVQT